MIAKGSVLGVLSRSAAMGLAAVSLGAAAAAPSLAKSLAPGNLLVSASTYSAPDIQPGVTQLPPGCTPGNCQPAVADGAFPYVFNNDSADGHFGVTSKAFLDELSPAGRTVARIAVPTNQFVTSFSSKSELALNLSPEGRYVSFMGYVAKPAMLDVSNANTPGDIDPSNSDPGPYYRVVAQLDRKGQFNFTETNAYSGDNGRAAIANDENGADLIYSAGNAGGGTLNPEPDGIIVGAGAQFITPAFAPESEQDPGQPTPLGSFNITELGYPQDKFSKDNNFRALTIFNNVVYYTKGSGGNGINTVYFVDTTGTACPNGVGLPAPGAPLPSSPLAYDSSVLQTEGLKPNNMCILKGFPTNLAKSTSMFPFGMFFANADTLYVADEGSGDNTYSTATGQYTNATAAAQRVAGLEKWIFVSGAWKLAYTLQNGLALGQPYTVPGYPTGDNAATSLPWSPATDGLRALTGRVYRNGKVSIWAVTSTVSGSGDQGADPDKLVQITDGLSDTTLPASESFATLRTARSGEILRGVSFTPGTVAH